MNWEEKTLEEKKETMHKLAKIVKSSVKEMIDLGLPKNKLSSFDDLVLEIDLALEVTDAMTTSEQLDECMIGIF